jgi:hypothetical protein
VLTPADPIRRSFVPLVAALALCLAGTAQTAPQTIVISEFIAANASGLQDADGEFSDWIEIYNPGSTPVSLRGWRLTDDSDDLAKWVFPDVTLASRAYLIVFASGKNRTNAAAQLHTNFSLDREGEYLALVRPDGAIAHQLNYPFQVTDVSYGVDGTATTTRFISTNAPARLRLPADNADALTWMQPVYNDSAWQPVQLGIGYDRIPPGETDPSEPPSAFGDVTTPGDVIVPTSERSPNGEEVDKAIDNTSSTKYLNFDKLNMGFTVTPGKGSSVVTGLRLTSANDAPDRDPTSFVLSGSQDASTFTEIARGAIPNFTNRFTTVSVSFSNQVAYNHYRLIFPTVRDPAAAVAMQIAEVEFLGYIGGSAPSLRDWITTDIESQTFQQKSSAQLRVPFAVATNQVFENLRLKMRYDDGFVAWLNGTRVAAANAPLSLAYNAFAQTNRFRRAAAQEVVVDLNAHTNLIQPGTNLLALQGWNDRLDSPDFLLSAQLEDTAFRFGSNAWFELPTPGAENGPPSAGIVSNVVASHSRGFYEAPFDLVLSCPTPQTLIRYTLDGSAPNLTQATTYIRPIRINRTTVLRATAFRLGWRASPVHTATYLFLNDVVTQTYSNTIAAGFPTNWNTQAADYGLDPRVVGSNDTFGGKYTRTLKTDLRSVPTMSIVLRTDEMFGPQGIYANPEARGDLWERAASLEMIYPDGRPGFQQDAGIRIQGGAFRRFDLTLKKSFRMVFRERYGAGTLRYPLFGENATDEFNNFILRANSNDGWPYGGGSALYVRDSFATESMRRMNRVASHSRFVHLFINGLYWGLYNPIERPDAAFSASYFGGDRDTWDALNQDSAPDGNYDAWNRLLSLLNGDLTQNTVYQRIQGNNPDGTRNPAYEDLLDVEDMIDYMILNFYVGNADWPGRNWWAGRDRNNGDGFKFYPWDTETALGLTGVDHDSTGVNGAVARPYAALRTNATFRLQFADQVHRHFYNGGVFYVNPTNGAWNPARPENNRPAARFVALAAGISNAIVGETARWGDQLRTSPYTRDEHWLPALNSLVGSYFPRRSSNVIAQFRRAGLYPITDAPVFNQHGGLVNPGFQLTMTARAGIIYYTTNGTDPRSAGALRYASPITLNDLTTVKARALNGSEWSALNEATFVVGQPRLVLTELHYHPADATSAEVAAGFTSDNDFEFIELHNNGTATYDLTGLRFTMGIEFNFATSSIPRLAAGEYLLVVNNRAAFEFRYGTGHPIAGEYSGRLDNAGERIQILDTQDRPVLDFSYGTLAPWPISPDGTGPSLEVRDPNGDLNDPANWRPSATTSGSPGQQNPAPAFSIELLSPTTQEVRLVFDAHSGMGYTVYASQDLQTWEILRQEPALDSDRRIELTITVNPGTRFFRVSMP